ncbi:MAG: hypothetical protein GEV03_22160 [Streptosporangiales bacterium]|nr:hypothetical protein [Streptosporangiales bacterium]
MCEPAKASGFAVAFELTRAVVATKAGRRVVATLACGAGVWWLAATPVTLPLLVPVALGAAAVAATAAAAVMWRKTRITRPAAAAVPGPERRPVAAIEAPRPRPDALHVLVQSPTRQGGLTDG